MIPCWNFEERHEREFHASPARQDVAVADTPEEAIRLIYAEPKWDASLRKIAAI